MQVSFIQSLALLTFAAMERPKIATFVSTHPAQQHHQEQQQRQQQQQQKLDFQNKALMNKTQAHAACGSSCGVSMGSCSKLAENISQREGCRDGFATVEPETQAMDCNEPSTNAEPVQHGRTASKAAASNCTGSTKCSWAATAVKKAVLLPSKAGAARELLRVLQPSVELRVRFRNYSPALLTHKVRAVQKLLPHA